MKLIKVDAHPIKMEPTSDKAEAPHIKSYGDYFIATDAWTSIYSRSHETCLVRLETDTGLVSH